MGNDLAKQASASAYSRLDMDLIELFIERWIAGYVNADDITPYVRGAAREAVEPITPWAEPAIDPRDNGSHTWQIGIGASAIVVAIYSAVSGYEPWVPLVALIGIVLVIYGASQWTTQAKYLAAVEAKRLAAWKYHTDLRLHTWRKTTEILLRAIYFAIGRRLGVPERLIRDFGGEIEAHSGLTRHQWDVMWWVAQPEYPPAPGGRSERLGHDQYESYSAAWMRSRGWLDASATRYTQDGGVDVESDSYVVQCKHYDGGYVGARETREIFGVAQMQRKRAAVITSGRYTRDAIDFAARAGVALIHLDELAGEAEAINAAGVEMMAGPSPDHADS